MNNVTLAAIAAVFALVAADAGARSASEAYATQSAASAQACANLCAADGLCMAWTYRNEASACGLFATTPAEPLTRGVTVGLAARAPDFARREFSQARSAPETPLSKPTPEAAASEGPAADAQLLGGREDHAELRLRLDFETDKRD